MPARPHNEDIYNDAVPMGFTRALLVQARAHDRDIDGMLERARFPFDPLSGEVQTVFVSREQYSRLCRELFRELGDESGGVMPDVRTPVGTTRMIALSMLGSGNLASAMRRASVTSFCTVRSRAHRACSARARTTCTSPSTTSPRTSKRRASFSSTPRGVS